MLEYHSTRIKFTSFCWNQFTATSFFLFLQIILYDQALNRSALLSKHHEDNNQLYCPMDTAPNAEFRDDLPTLLGNKEKFENDLRQLTMSVIHKLKAAGPSIGVFHQSSRAEKKALPASVHAKFVSPYERYLAVLPFAEQERLAETARLAEENRQRKLCPDAVITVVSVSGTSLLCSKAGFHWKFAHFCTLQKVNGETPATPAAAEKPVALKHFGQGEESSPVQMPPEKKRKLEDNVESKLNEIRKNMESNAAAAASPSQTPKSKKNKKNKKPDQPFVVDTQPKQAATFDYSNVDFKAFGGGSQKPKPDHEFKSKFKGKGKVRRAS